MHHRETMSSLKARDQAYRVATGILYDRPIDVMSIDCSRCGARICAGSADPDGMARCPACGTENHFPAYAAARIREALAAEREPTEEEIRAWRDVVRAVRQPRLLTVVIEYAIIVLLLGLLIWMLSWSY